MAYARFSEESQVHVYADHSFGGLTCSACVTGLTVDEMVAHLEEHKEIGHRIPEDLISRILAHRDFIDAYPPQTKEQLMRRLTGAELEEGD
jgi:hypothetical protein